MFKKINWPTILIGFGSGLLIASLLHMIFLSEPSESEIREKAAKLGMVDIKYLIEENEFNQKDSIKESVPKIYEKDTTKIQSSNLKASEMIQAPDELQKIEPEKTIEPEKPIFFELEILQGESSVDVSKKLEELGIFEAEKFNYRIIERGRSRSIREGVYKIYSYFSMDQVIDIISKEQ